MPAVLSYCRSAARCAGFTLVEMLVVMTLAAILMSMALPQFGRVIAGNKLTSQADLLSGAFHYGRAEAVRRDAQVAMCPLNASQNGCQSSGSANWSYGALLFQDADHSGSYSQGKELRRLQLIDSAAASSIKVSGPSGLIVFREDGHTSLAAAAQFSVLNCANQLKKTVELSVFGRAQVLDSQAPTAQECA